MKKLSKELLISGLFALVLIILSFVLLKVANFDAFFESNQATDLSSVVAIGAAALAGALVLSIVCVIIPIIGVAVEFLLTLIARLFNIGQDKKWKRIVGHIFFIPALIIHFLLVVLYVYIVIAFKSEIYLILLFLTIGTFIPMVIIYAKKSEK